MRRYVLLTAWMCFACSETPYEIYIDADCPEQYINIAKNAIEEMNYQFWQHRPGETAIEYKGLMSSSITDVHTVKAQYDSQNVIICSAEPGENPLGLAAEDEDIMIYVDRIRSGLEEGVMYHELGHFIGMDHTDNKMSVMYPTITAKTGAPWFTDADWDGVLP